MSDAEQPTRPGIWSDLAPTLVWMGLFLMVCVMGFLLLYPPHVNFEDRSEDSASGTVCSSVVSVGRPRADSSTVSRGVDDLGRAGYDEAEAACDGRRTGAVAAVAVLAVPTSLSGCWLMIARSRRPPLRDVA
ncbi:hypothetical protein [Nocardioides dongxiaopingii]|uniref:hypothetical protein n=1 Tax=Nocardioides dongxiaopingii TaxID=2576036 RepID=UPI0010C76973|nr:hypothetical protein [Nocardioides dongxiaopingii]